MQAFINPRPAQVRELARRATGAGVSANTHAETNILLYTHVADGTPRGATT